MSDWKVVEPLFTKNLDAEPSFETGVGSWTAGGTNLIAQSANQQYRGVYSAKCTYQDDPSFAQFPFTAPNAGTFTLSAWVWISAGFDGDNVRITGINYTGGTESIVAQWVDGANPRGWYRLETRYTFDAGDLVGSISIEVPGGDVPSVGRIIHVDAVQIEAGAQITTYCDGDQEGCEWLGTPHASQSQRSALSRAGGIEQDLRENLFFGVDTAMGWGMSGQDVNVDEYVIIPGGQINSIKVLPRMEARLQGNIRDFGDPATCNLHAMRQTLTRALSPRSYPKAGGKPQAVRLIYTGAAVDKIIPVHLSDGLEANNPTEDKNANLEKATLHFVSPQAFWKGVGDSAAVLDSSDDGVSMESAIARLRSKDGQWDVLGPPSSGGEINTIVRGDDGSVYWAGNFLNFDGIAAADRVVRRDTQAETWNAVGAGLNGRVRGSAKAPNGDIYFVGDFTDVSGGPGNTYNYIVKLDVSTGNYVAVMVSGPNNGLNAAAYDCEFATNGKLYIVGSFTDVDGGGGGTYNRVIEYDPQTDAVAALGTGLAGTGVIGKAVSSNQVNGHVIVGGVFTTAGGVSVVNVADWTPATATVAGSFAAMGNGLSGGAVNTLSTNSTGVTYAFGEFGSGTFNHAAQYKGQQWANMGTGLVFDSLIPPPVIVKDSTIAPDGTVIAAGLFNKADDIFVFPGIAGWNGDSWFPLDFKAVGDAYAVLADNPDPLTVKKYDIWVGFGTSPATFSRAALTTVSNDGTADARPTIKIKRGGGTSAKLRGIANEATGDVLRFDYRLQDGEELTIVTEPTTQSVTSSFFPGQRMDAILPNSDLGAFVLLPGSPGSGQVVTVFVEITGGATVDVTALWRDTYEGFD